MTSHLQIPFFDADAIGEQIASFYASYSYLETLYAILGGTDWLLQKLPSELEGVDAEVAESWKKDLGLFADRFRWYIEASEAGEGPNEVEELVAPPLFDGEYEDDFDSPPPWPDIETPWRLINRLVKNDDAGTEFSSATTATELQEVVTGFWEEVSKSLMDELAGGEDVDVEAEKAIDDAKAIAVGDHPTDVVSDVSRDAVDADDDEDDGSVAPLLLGIGAILLMASKRRR